MCHLRGLCYAKRNAFDRAKLAFTNAIKIDVQCFEAFDELMKNSLLRPSEELKILDELDFDSIRTGEESLSQEAAQFTKLLYTTRLSKYASPAAQSHAAETLSTHYNLSNNPDLLLSRAETLYTQCRFQEALTITSSILDQSESNMADDAPSAAAITTLGHPPTLYPLHLACLYEMRMYTTLFLLSHTLSQHAPHEYYTYLAIGTYYLATYRIAEARRFFSKASLMNSHSAASWTGFAHTFAAEGEHDQAIAAYSTAVRLFQGSHLPQLFIGMQHLALNNMTTAWEHCFLAYQMSSGSVSTDVDPQEALFGLSQSTQPQAFMTGASLPAELSPGAGGDPLVLNELGVILYHQANLPAAVQLFRKSLDLANELGWSPDAWVATQANMAHGLRRLGRLDESLAELDACLRVCTGEGSSGSASTLPHGHLARGSSVAAGISSSSSAVAGRAVDDRALIGSIQTSRGLVLLSLEKPQEAVLALHEAVRVLGGDASGGGMAGSLLSRAIEVWGHERLRRDTDVPTTTTTHTAMNDADPNDNSAMGDQIAAEQIQRGKTVYANPQTGEKYSRAQIRAMMESSTSTSSIAGPGQGSGAGAGASSSYATRPTPTTQEERVNAHIDGQADTFLQQLMPRDPETRGGGKSKGRMRREAGPGPGGGNGHGTATAAVGAGRLATGTNSTRRRGDPFLDD